MEKQLTGTLALAVFTAALGSLIYGYSLGVINAPQKFTAFMELLASNIGSVTVREFKFKCRTGNGTTEVLESKVIIGHYARSLGFVDELQFDDDFNLTAGEPEPDSSSSALTMYWSLSVAMFPVGGIVSSFMVGSVADFRGRVKGMLGLNVLAVIASLLMGLAKMGNPHVMVISGRAIMGLYCGLSSGLVPMYIGEIAPMKYRGALGTLHQLAIVTGILISQLLGLDFLLGNDSMWHLLLGLSGAAAVLQSLLLPLCPESPRYLYIKLGKKEEACKSLKRLKGDYDTTKDIAEMQAEKEEAMKEDKISILRLLRSSVYRQQLFVALMMHLSQQFSGINAIFYYSTAIFHKAGVAQPVYATIGVGVVNTVFTLLSVVLVDRAGRRTLMLVGLGGMCICAVGMTVGLVYLSTYGWMSYLSLAAIFLFVCFFEIGPGPIPWFIVAELFSQGPRPAAIALAGCCNWTSNFVIGMFFPFVEELCGTYVFVIFVVLLLLFTIFTWLRVPETKGKTFEEIAAIFQRRPAPSSPRPLVEAELQQLKTDTEA